MMLGLGVRRVLSTVLFVAPVTYFGALHARKDDRALLPGATSSGHHQIEGQCDSCHVPFGGVDQNACLRCHGESLRARSDSHAPAKFDDPAKAADLAVVDARSCLPCHREHRPEARTRGSVTVSATFCIGCHASVGRERPSHAGFDAAGCASAGCHNYHDNRALTRDFLERHRGQPALLPTPRLSVAVAAAPPEPGVAPPAPLAPPPSSAPGRVSVATTDWARSAHARASVGCARCHAGLPETATEMAALSPGQWQVADQVCANCHQAERAGFLAGKHGMRIAAGLTAMSPALALAPEKMNPEAHQRTLGCTSCHGAHQFERSQAAVSACEGCHNDVHTRTYRASPHFAAWQREQSGERPAGTGVSCASCHLPRRQAGSGGEQAARVEHNQNGNLRPSDRMAREVCLQCHGLSFSLAALADAALVDRNFAGAPVPAETGMTLVEKGEKHEKQ